MRNWQVLALLALILVVAAVLRLTGLDWDDYHHYHPDERYITWVATTIEWPTDWLTGLRPQESSWNPFYWGPAAGSEGIITPQDRPRQFAYGHVPLYLGVLATRLAEWVAPWVRPWLPAGGFLADDVLNGVGGIEFRQLTAVSRFLTALFDVGTVGVLFLLGRRLYGTAVGLLAAAFLSLNVMHIQLAHFFTSDPYLTFFVVTAVYFLVLSRGEDKNLTARRGDGEGERWEHWRPWGVLVAAIFVGLAVGSKFSAVLLLLPLWLATTLAGKGRRWVWFGTAVAVAFLTFAMTNPFALLDWNCTVLTPAQQFGPFTLPALDWRSCYLDNVLTQGAMVRGELDVAFTRQYAGTRPYLYPLEMQLRWGMGPLLGLVAWGGFGWTIWQAICPLIRRTGQGVAGHLPLWLTLAWSGPFFLTTAGFYVKFMRYLQPLTPFVLLYGAAWLWQWRGKWWRDTAVTLTLLLTGLWALAFMGVYTQPHPWDAASRWIYAHVPPQSLILSEQWDDPLPTTMVVGAAHRRWDEYQNAELTWLTGTEVQDDRAKLEANLELLAQADYLVVISHRVYGVVPRLRSRYPLSHQYHQLLFAGRLGYKLVAVYGRFPHLGPVYLKPDTFGWPGLTPPTAVTTYLDSFPGLSLGRADESFLVYDQPLTMVWQNVSHQSAAEMAAQFAQHE